MIGENKGAAAVVSADRAAAPEEKPIDNRPHATIHEPGAESSDGSAANPSRAAGGAGHAERAVRRFALWAAGNRDAFGFMARLAGELAARGERIGAQRLIEEARRRGFSGADGRPTRVNNDYSAPLARYVCQAVPGAARLVELRTRAYDGIDVAAEVGRAMAERPARAVGGCARGR